MAIYDWQITHSYTINEEKIDNEFSFMKNFGWRLYDAGGTYVEAHYQRSGTDIDPDQNMVEIGEIFLILPTIILKYMHKVFVGNTLYDDMHLSFVWKKGLGVKSRAVGDAISVSIVLTSNGTITEETAGSLYKVGNLYIKIISGSASLAANTLTVSGSNVIISVGIGSSFDPESNYFGMKNENLNLTSTAPSKGIKITEQMSGEVVYFRWDDLDKLYEAYTGAGYGCALFIKSNTNRKLPIIAMGYRTHAKDINYLRAGIFMGLGWRANAYVPPDGTVFTDEWYQPYPIPTRVIYLVSGNYFGFAYEGKYYEADEDLIGTVVYAKTLDLENDKALITREINSALSHDVSQQGGLSVSYAIEGTIGKSMDTWGYKYWNGSSWVERTTLPSTYYYDQSLALEIKRVSASFHVDYAAIIYAVSLYTNKTIEYHAALADNDETYLYPQITGEHLDPYDYIKEIAVAYYGNSDEYGSTLEGKVTVPSALDSKDFNKTLNNLSDAQEYGFDVAILYDPSTDTYSLGGVEAAPPTPAEQIQEMVTTFIEQLIPLLINLMMLMIIMSLLTSIIERRK